MTAWESYCRVYRETDAIIRREAEDRILWNVEAVWWEADSRLRCKNDIRIDYRLWLVAREKAKQ